MHTDMGLHMLAACHTYGTYHWHGLRHAVLLSTSHCVPPPANLPGPGVLQLSPCCCQCQACTWRMLSACCRIRSTTVPCWRQQLALCSQVPSHFSLPSQCCSSATLYNQVANPAANTPSQTGLMIWFPAALGGSNNSTTGCQCHQQALDSQPHSADRDSSPGDGSHDRL